MKDVHCTAWALGAWLLLSAGPLAAQEGPEGPGLRPPEGRRQEGLVFSAPTGWQAAPPRGAERGRWLLPPPAGPRAEGEPTPARLVVGLVRLGPQRPLAEHLARWARAFQGPDGAPLDPAALAPEALEVEGIPCQVVELHGTWVAPPHPGAEEWQPRPDWAALRALLDGPDGQWSLSLDGPAEAVAAAREQWLAFVKSAKPGLIPAAEGEPGEEPAGEGQKE